MQLAGCVIKDISDRILLIHRNTPRRTQWEMPGGKVDPGESPSEAAIREIKEELGVSVRIIRQIGEKPFIEDGNQHNYCWFEAEIINGEPLLVESDRFDSMRYFSVEDMATIADELSANAQVFLRTVKAKQVKL